MERDRRVKVLGIVALVIGLIGLTIAFAAMSRVLRINGSGNVDRANWDIHFRNVTFLSKSATASISGDPEPSNTNKGPTITGLNVTLKQPGDYVKYTADIKNEGDIDAAIKLVTPPELSERQNNLFEFKAEYTDVQAKGTKVIEDGDILRAGDIKNITITFKYKDEVVASQLPSTPEGINLTYSILYEQLFEESTETTSGSGAPSKTLVKQLDVSKGENDNVTAYFYSDDTVTIEGTGEIDSDVSDNLRFENTEAIDFYKEMFSWMGADTSNVDSVDDFESLVGELPEEVSNNFDERYQIFMFIKTLEHFGYEGAENITNMEDMMTYLIENGIMDEEGNPTEEGEEILNYSEELNDSLDPEYSPREVRLSEGITNVPTGIYSYNEDIDEVNLPSTITKIEDNAFTNCTNITEIELPSSVTEIGNSAFYNCTNLEEITIGSSSNAQGVSLNGVTNSNTSNITSIGTSAFYNCTSLTNINHLIANLSTINNDTFYNCTSLTSVTIPNSVTTIGSSVFGNCTELTSISVPATIDINYNSGLRELENLEQLTLTGNGPMVNYISSPFANENIRMITIGQGVTSIGDNAFYYCRGLTNISIPNSVTSIGEKAFEYSGLTNITIPNSVTSIGEYAFSDCSGLTSISLSNTLTSIENHTFYNCTSLSSITIPNSVTSIGDGSFYNCTSLSSIIIPNSVTSIGDYAFSQCTNLFSIAISNNVSSMGEYVFSGWTSSQTINIDNTSSYVSENWDSSWRFGSEATINYLRD